MRQILAVILLCCWTVTVSADDTIEFLSGAKAVGTVKRIDKEGRKVTFETTIAGRTLSREYPYAAIHAVNYQGNRYVLTEKSSSDKKVGSTSGEKENPSRSKAQVKAAIEEAGKTPPEWFESTKLDFPDTLDLKWPEPAPPPWDSRKNIGQYIWDVINPNAARWRSGIRFMHHLLAMHKDDPRMSQRCTENLGGMYFRFFQDYARAAFWWQRAEVGGAHHDSVALAECYFRLGNKQMAVEMLSALPIRADAVKLWGDMGETAKALQAAEALAPAYRKQGVTAGEVYMQAGDACRQAGQYQRALAYYQKVLDEPKDLKGRIEQNQKRATSSIDAIKLFELSDVKKVADGTYQGTSLGYEGNIAVEVIVKDKHIEAVRITEHKEKQYYSALRDIPEQILTKQSVKGVDATSRATITAEAILNATAKALDKGTKTQ